MAIIEPQGLSGFAFPFRGMPHWAQWIGEVLPLTHFIRIVRGIMLKCNGFADMRLDVAALAIFMFAAMSLALFRFRKTLDWPRCIYPSLCPLVALSRTSQLH